MIPVESRILEGYTSVPFLFLPLIPPPVFPGRQVSYTRENKK